LPAIGFLASRRARRLFLRRHLIWERSRTARVPRGSALVLPPTEKCSTSTTRPRPCNKRPRVATTKRHPIPSATPFHCLRPRSATPSCLADALAFLFPARGTLLWCGGRAARQGQRLPVTRASTPEPAVAWEWDRTTSGQPVW
jgi:hypothetical protein